MYKTNINEKGHVKIFDTDDKEIHFEGELEEIADNENIGLSLNFEDRIARVYLLTLAGAHITTGKGASYNSSMSLKWQSEGFRKPLLTYISYPEFMEVGEYNLSAMIGRIGIVEDLTEASGEIKLIDSELFGKLTDGIK